MTHLIPPATAKTAWARYEPSKQAPWDLRRVVHLHRRAGFAATWEEIQRDLKDGPAASVERLLAGKSRRMGVPKDFSRAADTLQKLAAREADTGLLSSWWMYRMLFGPDPLGERLTLFWHNYFSTSAAKAGMTVLRQNEIFRRLARAPFGELLREVVRDPALLIWLDAPANRKEHPNENLARELMELFTLGIGHFTEKDVKEAARALTGWTLVDGKFRHEESLHDPGEKTILRRRGPWNGGELVRILLEQPATAEHLALRLCGLFFGEGAVDAAGIRSLAAGLRDYRLNIGWAVGTVLRSEAFFAEANLGSRVLGPVEYVIGSARALELLDPAPNPLVLAEYATGLGQRLFYPPNVGGWREGRAWISTRTAIGRANYGAALLRGEDVGLPGAFDALGLARRHHRGDSLKELIRFYAELLLGGLPDVPWGDRVLDAVDTTHGKRPAAAAAARQVVALILASPEGQLL
jgi:uncharacterized protein (DUF1800 family)